MDIKRITVALIAPTVALTMAAALSPVWAAPRCEASVDVQLDRVERKELVTTNTYTVDVTTAEPCATIHFALYTTERISKTKVKVVKTEDQVRVRNGTISRILSHDMPNARELVRSEVKLTGCERCEP
jgi:hypothetical protein